MPFLALSMIVVGAILMLSALNDRSIIQTVQDVLKGHFKGPQTAADRAGPTSSPGTTP